MKEAFGNEKIIEKMGRASKNVMRVFRYLEANPIVDIGKTAERIGVSFNTVSSAVKRMIDAGILVQTENASRNRTFSYDEYLKILRKGT